MPTIAITNDDGTLVSQQRYLPFGDVRDDVSNLTQTDYGYTGQRNLGSMGLMDYKARFYSPLLGRFTQPDSMTPGGPQGLNRYSYVINNPINLNDPTGHCFADGHWLPFGGDGECTSNSGSKSRNTDGGTETTDSKDNLESNLDIDGDGFTDLPNPNAELVPTFTYDDIDCAPDELVECFYRRGRLASGDWDITQEEMEELFLAVYYDVSRRTDYFDRYTLDTPFWDGYNTDVGKICVGPKCSNRVEANYFLQGMYSAKFETKMDGLFVIDMYKQFKYGKSASEGTIYWFNQGFDYYQAQ